jgi:ligand-binding sensor domain-containing protein
VWVATINGLMVYDAGLWTHYTTTNSALPDNYVRTVVVEAGGVAWVGTLGGLVRVSGLNWTVFTEANSGLPASSIASLALAPDGALWVGAFEGVTWPYHGGVARFDGLSWVTYTSQNSPLLHEQVEGLAVDAEGGVWVATASQGVAYIHPASTTADEPSPAPSSALAMTVRPNPLAARGDVILTLPAAATVQILVFDAIGRLVLTAVDEALAAGRHVLEVDLTDLPPGVYLLRATAGRQSATARVSVVP